jgi:glycosyltransferase involved in cell wall biosynthesis
MAQHMNSQTSVGPAQPPHVGDPRISVVIPTRGRPAQVVDAVRSAQLQSLPPYEIVVVVDGADPVSVDALQAIADGRLHILELPTSRGGAGARNAGIAACTGDWVALLDDDDTWAPTKLAEQWRVVENAPARERIVVATGVEWRTEIGSWTWPTRGIRPGERVADYLFVRTMPGEGFLATPSILLSRELAAAHPMPEHLTLHEDLDWFLALEASGARFVVVTKPLVHVNGGTARVSLSRSADWSRSLGWAMSRRTDLEDRAFSAFCLTEAARALRHNRSLRPPIAVLAMSLTGKPRPRDLVRFLGIVAVPETTRWRLGKLRRRMAA